MRTLRKVEIGHRRGRRLGVGVPDVFVVDHHVIDEQVVAVRGSFAVAEVVIVFRPS